MADQIDSEKQSFLQKTKRRVLFVATLITGILIASVAGLLFMSASTPDQLSSIQKEMNMISPIMAGVRFTVIGLTIAFWEKIILFVGKTRDWESGHVEHVLSMRWKVGLWLLTIELILGQNIIGKML